jgi:hypothetical protein
MFIKNFYVRYVSGYREYFQTFKGYGLAGLSVEFKNRSRIWTIKEYGEFLKTVGSDSTSISDEPNYLAVCLLALQDHQVLAKFKRCHEYRLVLEHVTRHQGKLYLEYIKGNNLVLQNMKVVSSKEIGDPLEFLYEGIGYCSPTQIRYAKIMQDLQLLFDLSQVKSISEIGVGNGGQAAQICNLISPESYNFIDLEPVLDITNLLISNYDFDTDFNYLNPNNLDAVGADLLISNYAFSELNKVTQDVYLEKVLYNSKRGFMLYNNIHENPEMGYIASEILELVPGSAAFAEDPCTYPGNLLIAWGFDPENASKYFTAVDISN